MSAAKLASEASRAEKASVSSASVSSVSKRANGPLLASGFLVVLDKSAQARARNLSRF